MTSINPADFKPRIRAYLTAKSIRTENGKYQCPSPDHPDEHPSAVLYDESHTLYCPVCAYTADVFDVAGMLTGASSFPEQAEEIRLTLGINGAETYSPHAQSQPANGGTNGKKPKPDPVVPIPEEAKSALNEILRSEWSVKNRGQAVRAWRYTTADGGWWFGVVRFEKSDGGKTVIPFYYGEDGRWHQGLPQKKSRPLYRLYELTIVQADKPVIVTEGEKDADAAQELFGDDYVVTTWPGGSSSVGRADWAPLKTRVVTVWPDRDAPGRKIIKQIARILPHARFIDPGEGEDGWGAADAVSEGWTREQALELVSRATQYNEPTSSPDLPEVIIQAGNTPHAVREALSILADGSEPLYQLGDETGPLCRVAGHRLEPVHAPALLDRLERNIAFVKWNERAKQFIRTDAPVKLAQTILDLRGEWPFPSTVGMIHGPTLRLDGTILDAPGYDPETRILYVPKGGDAPVVPPEPTKDDARTALATLWHPFREFPYAGPADIGAALALKLTAAIRAVLPTSPAGLVKSPEPGTGKGLETQATCAIASGEIVAAQAWPTGRNSEEEVRKAILSWFINAPAAVIVDNVLGGLGSGQIARLLTAGAIGDRVLGQTLNISVPTRALIIFNGNNVHLTGDLPRRFLTVSLDAQTEAPWLREFDFNVLEMASRDWLKLRVAALTVLRAFFVDGAPKIGAGTFGSFEHWDRTVRQCLLWVQKHNLFEHEIEDPLEAAKTAKHLNPDQQALAALLEAWHAKFASEPVTVHRVVETASDRVPGGDRVNPELYDALTNIAGDGPYLSTRSVGRWLSFREGRIVDGMCFKTAMTGEKRTGTTRWFVEVLDAIPF